MSIIQKTILNTAKYQRSASKYINLTNEVGNLVPNKFLNRSFSCVTCNNIPKEYQSFCHPRPRQISTANTSFLFHNYNSSDNSLSSLKKSNFKIPDNDYCKVIILFTKNDI